MSPSSHYRLHGGDWTVALSRWLMCAGPFHPIVGWLVQAGKVYRARHDFAAPVRAVSRAQCRAQQTVTHRALKLPPRFWPCLPQPGRDSSPGARALYAELDRALTGTC
jgi:hypothetical protein